MIPTDMPFEFKRLQFHVRLAFAMTINNARMRGFFLKNAWHFEDIFREFEAFLKISILFEDIFREIEAFIN
jgi:hypothetical protein